MKKNYSAEKRTTQTVKKSNKSSFLLFLMFVLGLSHTYAQDEFITTWKVVAGDLDITIPRHSDYTYNYTVNWVSTSNTSDTGTGSFSGDAIITFPAAGTYEVKITGTFPAINFGGSDRDNRGKIQTVKQWGNIEWQTMQDAFWGCTNLQVTASDVPDLGGVTSMAGMFRGASSLTGAGIDFNSWEVGNVTNMLGIFQNASAFNADISGWDVGNVGNMFAMFANASAFNRDIGGWNVSNVTSMGAMFLDASAFNHDLSSWNVSKVNSMQRMFKGASAFNRSLGSWNLSVITNMTDILTGSRMNCANYSATLIGWADNPNTNSGITLTSLPFGSNALGAIGTLINNKDWVIPLNADCWTEVLMPDPAFKAALLNNHNIDTSNDGEISYVEAANFTGAITVKNKGITDLTGIEAFVNLTGLNCSQNTLTNLDLSYNTALTSLECYTSSLASLNVSNNTAITYLNCADNSLTSLDLSNNTALTVLYCSINSLTSLDVSNNTALETSHFENNDLSCIQVDEGANTTGWFKDVTASFSAGFVNIPDTHFKDALVNNMSININGDTEISTCEAANFTGTIDVGSKGIADLTGIEAFVNITALNCSQNTLTSLDVSTNTALTTLYCEFNALTSLDVSTNTALTTLSCSYNDLTSLNVANGNNTNFTFFNAVSNDLNCIQVDDAVYSNANWTNLDVTASFSAGFVNIPDTHFKDALVNNTSINTNGDTEISTCEAANFTGTIDVGSKGIADLTGIEAFVNITALNCSQNTLTSLDVSTNTALTELRTENNDLTSLNVANGNNTNFTFFNAVSNDLNCIQVDDAVYSNANWTNLDDTASFSAGFVNIPDTHFKDALVNNTSINTNGDTEISTCEAANFTGAINVIGKDITDLTGIEAFVNVTTLYCGHNALTSLDVSTNTALTELRTENNALTSLNVSANTALTTLSCSSNALTSLDVAANTALTSLNCGSNALTSLDVAANTALTTLYCGSNALTSLDVSANTALTELSCGSNALTSLDVSANTALTSLYCGSNALTSLNLANGNNENISSFFGFEATNNPNLNCIQVDDVTYSNANWTNLDDTASFSTNCPPVYIPDVNFKNALVNNTSINTNGDTEISYAEAANFTGTINAHSRSIADLTGIEAFVNITTLYCEFNALTSLDMSANTALEELRTENNNLTSLDVSANTALTYLSCQNNALTSLDVSAKTALTTLFCNDNALTSLDVSANTALTYLFCEFNTLTSLDVSANTALTLLHCHDNALTSLDVSANTALRILSCSSNDLTSLDVSANTALRVLDCGFNDLTSLNLANGNNTNFTYFNAVSNDLNCIQVDDVTYSNTNWANDIDDTASFSANCPPVYIPDANFKNALLNDHSIDTSNDGEISYAEAANFTGTIDVIFKNIADLTGIEAFVNITGLDVSANTALTSLDVSANTALTTLYCYSNALTSLDVSANTALTTLYCLYNDLTSLNLANGNNESITYFNATNNPNLNCIQVDDVTYSNTNWANDIDGTASFSTNCAYPSNSSTATSFVAKIGSFTNTNAFTETVRVSPNPVVHTFSITGSASFTLKQAKVYDVLGKELISTTTNEVDASSLPNGMYIVRIESTDGKIETKKIIKK